MLVRVFADSGFFSFFFSSSLFLFVPEILPDKLPLF